MSKLSLREIQPYIRFVNNYKPEYSHVEQERILYDYELMYVMEGEARMHYAGKAYELKKGDVFYLQPFVKNYLAVDEKKGFRSHCVHFDWITPAPEDDFTAEEFYMRLKISENFDEKLELLKRRAAAAPFDLQLPNLITGMDYEKLSVLFAGLYYAYSEYGVASGLRAKGIFYEIIAMLYVQYSQVEKNRYLHPKIIHAMRYVMENYKQDISVPKLAERFDLSPKYFGSLFKSATGSSIHQYILKLRLGDAKDMLMKSDMSVEEIAERTGFHDAFYFSKCFKASEKMAPSEYRNMMRYGFSISNVDIKPTEC